MINYKLDNWSVWSNDKIVIENGFVMCENCWRKDSNPGYVCSNCGGSGIRKPTWTEFIIYRDRLNNY